MRTELWSLMQTIEEICPISQIEWDMVQRRHSDKYPEFDRSTTSLRKRYQKAVKEVRPIGTLNALHMSDLPKSVIGTYSKRQKCK